MAQELVCWNCGHGLASLPLPISRHANCDACFEVIHCCRMCIHFRPNDPITCDHDRTDPPVIKESANFCEYFSPADGRYRARVDRSAAAKTQLDSLFGDPQASPGVDDDARQKFDDLFDD